MTVKAKWGFKRDNAPMGNQEWSHVTDVVHISLVAQMCDRLLRGEQWCFHEQLNKLGEQINTFDRMKFMVWIQVQTVIGLSLRHCIQHSNCRCCRSESIDQPSLRRLATETTERVP